MEPPTLKEGTAIPPSLEPLLRDYRAGTDRYDELFDAEGQVRPVWRPFLQALSKIRREDFAQRWEQARDLIHDNGVTYQVYGDDNGSERPWNLDPIPMLLPQDEWEEIERALIQRARLFDRILADCYGPRRLVHERDLPPELLYANPRFLRPCHDLPLPRGRFLHFYAVDIARASNGKWWVLSDRTQAPSGMGYALENRVVVTRMIPEVARECKLVRFADYFRGVREALAGAAPRPRENPLVVLLTPGPFNETYFEHAFLSRYLGIPLVEGGDLTVRDDHVYLKTLDGLQRVDVIRRRIDEEFSDPLELLRKSQLGVSGLLEAIRKGNVSVLNPPGSGLVEAPALLAFLPALSRKLLGEELLMPSVATWWCGQKAARKQALERLDQFVVKDAFDLRRLSSRFLTRESETERALLEQQIRAAPHRYVAQEEVSFSTAPVWNEGVLEPRTISLRVHLVATEDGYAALPGGLTRFVATKEGPPAMISMQQGGGSKDTWIVARERPPDHRSPYEVRYPVTVHRGATDFPSRTADNLFWLGRYAERSEAAARILRQIVSRTISDRGFGALSDVAPLWTLLTEFSHLDAPPAHKQPAAAGPQKLEKAINDAIFLESSPGSLQAIHANLQRLASVSRDTLSLDTWRIAQQLVTTLRRRPARRMADLVPLLDRLVTLHAALAGMAAENTTRTQGWRFLDLGRRLERSLYLGRLGNLVMQYHQRGKSSAMLESILETLDSTITYRRRNFFAPRLLPVIDLVFYDPANPRALAYQIECIDAHLAHLPAEHPRPFATEARKRVTAILTELRTTQLGATDAAEEQEQVDRVKAFLGTVEDEIEEISNDVGRVYFSVLGAERSAGILSSPAPAMPGPTTGPAGSGPTAAAQSSSDEPTL